MRAGLASWGFAVGVLLLGACREPDCGPLSDELPVCVPPIERCR